MYKRADLDGKKYQRDRGDIVNVGYILRGWDLLTVQILSFLEKLEIILINISRNLLHEVRLHFTYRPWTGCTHQTRPAHDGEFDCKTFVQNQNVYPPYICSLKISLQQKPQEGSPVPPTCTAAITAT